MNTFCPAVLVYEFQKSGAVTPNVTLVGATLVARTPKPLVADTYPAKAGLVLFIPESDRYEIPDADQ